jgi:hypothetical protein
VNKNRPSICNFGQFGALGGKSEVSDASRVGKIDWAFKLDFGLLRVDLDVIVQVKC